MGSNKQASDYCLKGEYAWRKGATDNHLDELFGINLSPETLVYGEVPPEQTARATEAAADIWSSNLELALEGRLEEMTPKHRVQFYKHYEAAYERSRPKPKRLTWRRGESPNLWIYGPTGTGKSYKARELYPDLYEKMLNKWWDHYDDEEEILLEDVGESHAAWIGDFIKVWADIYPFRGEVKNSTKLLRPQIVIVTSNYHPKELFPNPNVHLPIMDRFKMMHLTDVYNPDAVVPPQENYPMFDVVREMFAVQTADEIPRGPHSPIMLSDSIEDSSDPHTSQVVSQYERQLCSDDIESC